MGAQILVADDDPVTRRILRKAIEKDGYEVLLASDGLRALTLLADNEDIALVVTDIVMPGIDGRDLILSIRRDGAHVNTPAIVISGNVPEHYVLVDDLRHDPDSKLVTFMAKPIDTNILMRVVRVRVGQTSAVEETR